MRLYAMNFDTQEAWQLHVSRAWMAQHDNGHLVSIGLVIPEDLSPERIRWMEQHHYATRVPMHEANHAGCQSACTTRGDTACRW